MSLAALFKGLVLSQGYVTTPARLREVAPEALPVSAPCDAEARPRDVRRACAIVPLVTVQLR